MAGGKKQDASASKKAEQKAKAKIIEDKTFGLKNKNKSAKVNKYVQQVTQQVQSGGSRKQQKEEETKLLQKKLKKEEEEKLKQEQLLLGKPVIVQPKVPFGADPKSFLCQAFKAGQCTKGDKCKFSHDLGVERKSAKIDLFADMRDTQKEEDTMDTWDQAKLETVVLKKHGPGVKTTTDIVCKYFIEAIENRKYGWFWECPNGGDTCKYRHALPPGYVFKQKFVPADNQDDDGEEKISLEEFLEMERHQLKGNLTPVTSVTFAAWKKSRCEKQQEERLQKEKKKLEDVRAGRQLSSGKEIFMNYGDSLTLMDDEEAFDDESILNERQEDYFIDVDGVTTAPDLMDEELFLAAEELEQLDIH